MVTLGPLDHATVALVVPSRGRPASAQRFIQAYLATRVTNETVLVLSVDTTDPELESYQQLADEARGIYVIVNPNQTMVEALNVAAVMLADKSAWIIGFAGDDHLLQTEGWDSRVMSEMTANGVVYGNDLLQGANLPTAVFVNARIVRALGYIAPPAFTHLYIDNVWKIWGQQLNSLVYCDDMVIEHLHPAAGKAPLDAGYARTDAADVWDHDARCFADYLEHELNTDLSKIRMAGDSDGVAAL